MIDLFVGDDGKTRCGWCRGSDLYQDYHDNEWGRAVHDDRRLFEKICLEGFQAGLSWITILKKRDSFREAFYDFDATRVAKMNDEDVERLMTNAGIIRNRAKIRATINNALKMPAMIDEFGSLDAFLWSFQPEEGSRPRPKTMADVPAITDESKQMSRQLKKRGWAYVGPTTCYAMMQAIGIVDDHLEGCYLATP
ncbi:MAG: DNA-3-methyladenine glycosylase I [Planctomycetota bacterium]